MPKKQSSNERTKIKALPKKSEKLSDRDMKKVKGGAPVHGGWDLQRNVKA